MTRSFPWEIRHLIFHNFVYVNAFHQFRNGQKFFSDSRCKNENKLNEIIFMYPRIMTGIETQPFNEYFVAFSTNYFFY